MTSTLDFDVTEASDVVSIEDTVMKLRKDIRSECSGLLGRARDVGSKKVGAYRTAVWDSKINRILELKEASYSIAELEGLLQECRMLSRELKQYEQ